MKHSMASWNALFAASSVIVSTVTAQSYSTCNPLTSGSCPADPALGKSVKVDFTSGASDSFTPQGNPVYGSNGAALTVSAPGDAPQLTSKWYIMFGHVDYVIKAAPGAGIVSSAVLQSDDLDEIDWEWLGGDDNQVQSNYFGKGLTLNYNRGAYHSAPGNHDGFTTYSVDWTADQITWSINGQTVRTLSSSTASQYPYPQTPMMVKVGAWCGGCSGNAEGTIQWAGATESIAPGSTMYVKSIAVTDYSTGSQYKYTGTAGTWQSIEAVGGKVNSNGSPGSANGAAAVAPSVSTSSNGGPMPLDGTHSDKQVTSEQPNAGGWTPTTTAAAGGGQTATTYPGLPSGWSVSSSGKVTPPSAAPVTPLASLPSSSPEGSQHGSPNGQSEEVVTEFDGKGFPIVLTVPAGSPAVAKHYDEQGFLITTGLVKSALPTPISSPEEAVADKRDKPDRPHKALRMYRRSLANSTSNTFPASSANMPTASGTAVGTGGMSSATSTAAPTFYQSSTNGATLAGVSILVWSTLAAGLAYTALLA